jgi:hypothetical protein
MIKAGPVTETPEQALSCAGGEVMMRKRAGAFFSSLRSLRLCANLNI